MDTASDSHTRVVLLNTNADICSVVGTPVRAATVDSAVGKLAPALGVTAQKPGQTAPPHEPVKIWGVPFTFSAICCAHKNEPCGVASVTFTTLRPYGTMP